MLKVRATLFSNIFFLNESLNWSSPCLTLYLIIITFKKIYIFSKKLKIVICYLYFLMRNNSRSFELLHDWQPGFLLSNIFKKNMSRFGLKYSRWFKHIKLYCYFYSHLFKYNFIPTKHIFFLYINFEVSLSIANQKIQIVISKWDIDLLVSIYFKFSK